MSTVSVGLSDSQKKKLLQAMQTGADFKTKLTLPQLDGDTALNVGKVMANKMLKARVSGKGCMLTMSSSQVKKSGKGLQVGNGLQVGRGVKRGGAQEPQSQKLDVLGQLFGYDDVLNIIQGLDKLMADRGVYTALAPVINSVLKELTFVIKNPEYQRYKRIYVERIPRLSMRWNKLDDKIQFIKRKPFDPTPKLRLARINRIQFAKDKIISTIKMLFMRLPRLMGYINDRNTRELGVMESQMNSEIAQAETQAQQAETEAQGAEWDEEDGGPVGRGSKLPRMKKSGGCNQCMGKGLQVDSASRYYGSGITPDSLINPSYLSLDTGLSMSPTVGSISGRGKKKVY